jgi:putative transposase
MSRLPRVVAPGLPHHVTQRANRRQQTFFMDQDYAEYCDLLADFCRRCGTRVLAYRLMPNHVHLIMVPADEFGLRDALGEAHRRYTRMINFRDGWRGHLWQERFHSFVMDEQHLLAAVRYVERNPVRARLCARWKIGRGRARPRTLRDATTPWSACDRCWSWSGIGRRSSARPTTRSSMNDCAVTPVPAGHSMQTHSSNPWSDSSPPP